MAKFIKCGEIMPDCPHELRAETEDELLRKAAEHARTAHGVERIDDAMLQKVRAAIRSER